MAALHGAAAEELSTQGVEVRGAVRSEASMLVEELGLGHPGLKRLSRYCPRRSVRASRGQRTLPTRIVASPSINRFCRQDAKVAKVRQAAQRPGPSFSPSISRICRQDAKDAKVRHVS